MISCVDKRVVCGFKSYGNKVQFFNVLGDFEKRFFGLVPTRRTWCLIFCSAGVKNIYFNTDINSYPNSVRETYLIIRERAKGNTSFTRHWSHGSMIVVQNFSEIRFNDVLMTS